MGSDDLFRKRKARKTRELARKAGKRKSRDMVLIVCEGEKTEPYYLEEICARLTNVHVRGKECGSDPLSVVKHGEKLIKEDGDFDKIFCVFDKDTHTTYQEAVDRVRRKRGKKWVTIKSVPCFEYWVLLHFRMTTRPFACCDGVQVELRREFGEYEKGHGDLYQTIGDKTDTAIANAKDALKAAEKTGTDNPTTEMHQLIEYLRELAVAK